MEETGEKIIKINIEEEMKTAYIDYSMSVIVARALPDVRDGLKPVHRRILYDMSNELNLYSDKPYRKSARIVGDVLGKFHPHGDSSVYDAMVRMAQEWSLRYRLVDGQGNFGSVDGDSPAAMRYTEARMMKITDEVMADIDKNTVDFRPNFDETILEPTVLPTKVPLLLVNGTSGIAVGMATNMPPHNLSEVVDACCAYIDNPEIETSELLRYVKAPDFPTGGIVYGYEGVREAYETGRGRVIMRSKTEIEHTSTGRECIIVTEIPYMVNKAEMIKKIADLINEKKLEGIAYINDESDRSGMPQDRCGGQRGAEQPLQIYAAADFVPGEQYRTGGRASDAADATRHDQIFRPSPPRRGGAPCEVRFGTGREAGAHPRRVAHRGGQH